MGPVYCSYCPQMSLISKDGDLAALYLVDPDIIESIIVDKVVLFSVDISHTEVKYECAFCEPCSCKSVVTGISPGIFGRHKAASSVGELDKVGSYLISVFEGIKSRIYEMLVLITIAYLII